MSANMTPPQVTAADDSALLDARSVAVTLAELHERTLEHIARLAKSLRLKHGLTVAQLAQQVEVPRARMTYMESCVPQRITGIELLRWSQTLRVTPQWFLEAATMDEIHASPPMLHECATIAEEIRCVAIWLTRRRLSRRTFNWNELSPSEQRWVTVFAMRYGLLGEEKSTLQQCGDAIGWTRERARQVLAKMAERLPELKISLPRLDQLRKEVIALLPASQTAVDEKLRPLLGEQLSIAGADRFSRECLGLNLVGFFEGTGASAKGLPPTVISPDLSDLSAVNSIRVLREASLRMIRSVGAAQLEWVTGMASQLLPRPLSPQEAARMLTLQPEFEWILEKDGWYWLGPNRENRLLFSARKMLAVADRRLDVEVIHAGLTRNRMERYREGLQRAVLVDPPQSVIVGVLSRTPWIQTIQYNDFRLVEITDPMTVLAGVEGEIYQNLKAHGGVASRYTINEEIAAKGDVLSTTLAMILDTTPIVQQLTDGVFALRGVPFTAQAYGEALQAVGGPSQRHFRDPEPITPDEDGYYNFEFEYKQRMTRSGQIDVPTRIGKVLPAGDYILSNTGDVVRLSVYDNGHTALLSLLTRHLRRASVKVGARVTVRINPNTRTAAYKVSKPRPPSLGNQRTSLL